MFEKDFFLHQTNMNEISQQQQQAGNKIIDAFCSGKTWVMECAQMQSGKTGCYLFTSCEMLRRNMVQHVIIFSGTADLDLKHQLIAEVQQCPGSRYFQNYASWLKKYKLSEYDETELIKNIKEKLYEMGAVYCSMTGSGSTVYGIFDHAVEEKIFPSNNYEIIEIKDGKSFQK